MTLPSNSNKSKAVDAKAAPPNKKVEQVVSGEVVQKPKSLGRKLHRIIFNGEFKGAVSYITVDVLLPAFRNMIVDATTKGIERAIYGDSPQRSRSGYGNRPRTSYHSPVNRGRPSRPEPRRSSRSHDFNDVILLDRNEAETVLERMADVIDQFEVVSLADLYELVGLPSTYVDNNWGWSNLAHSSVRQTRDGYLLELPQIESIV